MSSLNAADLQRKHELDGAPDPFPSLPTEDEPQPKRHLEQPANAPDTESQVAFPSLAPSATTKSTSSGAWGTGAAPRIQPAVVKGSQVSDSLTLSTVELPRAGKDGRQTPMVEVLKSTMARFKVKVETSSSRKSGQTAFHIKGDSQKEIDKAKRHLKASLSPTVSIVANAPSSTIPSIIGPKGATLKQIRDQTGVRVDIPRKEGHSLGVPGQVNGASHPPTRSGTPLPPNGAHDDNVDEDPMVPITINGPESLAEEARSMIMSIVASKVSKSIQRVRDIPHQYVQFVLARKKLFESAAQGEDIHLSYVERDREVIVSGEREAVIRVLDSVRATLDEFRAEFQSVSIQLPKKQHRLLTGKGKEDIFGTSSCAVVLPAPEDPAQDVKIWGKPSDLSAGLAAVMKKANSQYIHEFALPGPISLSKQLLVYLQRTPAARSLVSQNGASVYLPTLPASGGPDVLNIDIVGDKPAVDEVTKKLSDLIGKLIHATREMQIDWLLHRVLQGKSSKKLKQLHDSQNVSVFFPPDTAESSSVVLVYDPLTPSASDIPTEKAQHLDEVQKELQKLVKDAADVKSETLAVETKWHGAVQGQGGTTLNAIIGEEKSLSIKFGEEAKQLANHHDADVILLRGASADVDRARSEILRIVDEAKNDEIDNSHVVEFEINRDYVGRIVGTHGASVNRLREQLGVKLDFNDEPEDKESFGKKKKSTSSKAKVKIIGRKENVEEAKKRILGQVEKLADETTEILKIPRQYHPSLIGPSGKYVIRLEDKYAVKITFPRDGGDTAESKTREVLKADEVLVKGGKKGVSGAKAEILDAVEFEKESNNTIKFTVPTNTVARILGKGGATINEIKDSTGAQIDVDKAEDSSAVANITLRGTKKAISAAKTEITNIVNSIGDEITVTLNIDSKFHRTLIGAGGQGLRDLIVRCGGPADTKAQAGLVHFPKQHDPSDEVRLRGERSIVNKLKAELEASVSTLQDRVVLGVNVPSSQHRALIGRGGQNLTELQKRTSTQIQFPGSRSYQSIGEPSNVDALKDVDEQNIVKIIGSRAAAENAVIELTKQIRPPTPEAITATVAVPLKYHHMISQQGSFFRNLRAHGVNVDQSSTPSKSSVPPRPSLQDVPAARIDDEIEGDTSEIQWQVTENYKDAEDGESQWTLRARDQAGLDRAQKLINDAIEHAAKSTHVAFLTLPSRAAFPRIIGAKGATVARLRQETGAEITVGKEDNTIIILGSETALEAAKEAILHITESKGRK